MPMLKKMKMPKREEISMEELDMPLEEGGEEMSDELAGEAQGEGGMPEPTESSPALESVSDEDLLAEMKKRGLMGKLSEEEGMAGEEEVNEYDDEMMG